MGCHCSGILTAWRLSLWIVLQFFPSMTLQRIFCTFRPQPRNIYYYFLVALLSKARNSRSNSFLEHLSTDARAAKGAYLGSRGNEGIWIILFILHYFAHGESAGRSTRVFLRRSVWALSRVAYLPDLCCYQVLLLWVLRTKQPHIPPYRRRK